MRPLFIRVNDPRSLSGVIHAFKQIVMISLMHDDYRTSSTSSPSSLSTRVKLRISGKNWRKRRPNLKLRRGRIRARISARERKLRTRRLILIGSYMEHVTQTDPDRKARLMKGLDGFLERGPGPRAVRSPSKTRCYLWWSLSKRHGSIAAGKAGTNECV